MGKGVTARTMADLLAQAKDPTEAARIQRAIDAGRNQILYHGTHTDFPAVDPAKVDLGLHVGTSEQATNRLTDLAKAMRGADKYNTGAQIMPVAVRLGNSLDMRDVGGWESALEAGLALRKHPELEARQSEIDELLDSVDDMQRAFVAANQHMDDPYKAWLTSDDNRRALRDMSDLLVSDGYDSIKYRNEVENTHGEMGGLSPEYEKEASDIDARMREIKQAAIQRRPAVPNASDPNYPALMQDFLDRSPVLENFMTAEEKDLLQKYGSRHHDLRTSDQYRNSPYSHIILKPENLRSINAQFDPEFDLSDDLMKAEGGLVEDLPKFGKGQLFRTIKDAATDTPEFKNFFGESKVVNESGQPLRMYHGSGAEIDAFKPNSWWTDDSQYASRMARQQKNGSASNVTPAYLSLNKIARLKDLRSARETLPLGVPDNEVFKVLSDAGFDGLSAMGGTKEIIVFNPNKIKSAIGNEGTFDPTNPVITKAQGGYVTRKQDGGLVELANKYANGNTLQKFGKGQLFRTIQGGVSDAAEKAADALDMSQAARMQRAAEQGKAPTNTPSTENALSGYDTSFPITHQSSNPEFDGVIRNNFPHSVFDGIFGLGGVKGNALGSGQGAHYTYLPRTGKVARSGDVDLEYEKSVEFLKKQFPKASDDQIDSLYRATAEDAGNFSSFKDSTFDGLLYGDAGERAWMAQNLRGQMAVDQGFDAVAMSDEYGTSYFIPYGSKAVNIGKNFDWDSYNTATTTAPSPLEGTLDMSQAGKTISTLPGRNELKWWVDGGDDAVERGFPKEPFILLDKLYVDPQNRGAGAGRQILRDGLDDMAAQYPGMDVRLLAEPLDRDTNLSDLVRLYESVGFDVDGYEDGMSGVPMSLRLPKKANGGLVDLVDKYAKGGLVQKYTKGDLVRQWLKGYPEKSLAPLKRADDKKAETAALNNWLDTSLAKYIKRDYGSPNDPLAALAREQRHVPLREGVLGEAQAAYVWPPRQFGSQAGLIPYVKSTQPRYLGDRDASVLAENPWISSLAPDTPLYRDVDTNELGIAHLRDELYNAIRPDSDLPDQLRLQPESLPRVSVAQASQLVGKINAWRAAESAKAELAASMNPATFIHKEYPEKNMRWVEIRPKDKLTKLPDGYSLGPSNDMSRQSGRFVLYHPDGKESALGSYASEEEALKKALRVIGDDGGYQNIKDALKYETDHMHHCIGNPDSGYCDDVFDGLSRVFSLRDKRGAPHVTIETSGPRSSDMLSDEVIDEVAPGTFDDYLEQRTKRGGYSDFHSYVQNVRPDVYEELMRPEIRQIKGHGDRMPVDRYLPFVQDFVKSQKWANVKDLHHTGMRKSADAFQPYSITKARAEGIDLPDYLTEQEIADITAKLRAINKPAGMKEGGMARPDVRDNPDNESYEESKRRKKTGIDMLDSALDPLYAIRAGIRAQYRPQDVVWTDDEGNRHSYTAPGLSNSTVGLGMFLPGENPMSDAAMDAYTSGLNYENEMAGLPSSELMNKYTHFGNTLGEVLGQLPIGPAVVGRGMLSKAAMVIPDYLGPFMRPSVGNYAGAAMAGEALPHLIGGMMSLAEKYGLGSDTPIDADESDRLLASLGIESVGRKIDNAGIDRYIAESEQREAARERMASMVYGSLPRYEKGQLVKGVNDAARAAREAKGITKSKRRVESTGKYVGAPAGVDSPQALAAMRTKYLQDVMAGVKGRKWYGDSSDWIQLATSDDIQAEKLAKSLGVTSQGTGVDTNLGFTINAFNQRAAGQPVSTGRFPSSQSPIIESILDDASTYIGPKRDPFARNLGVNWSPELAIHPVHDIWQGRAFGYTNPDGSPWDGGFSSQQHAFMDEEMKFLIDRANKTELGGYSDWDPLKAQAAAWTGAKVRAGDIDADDAAKHFGSFAPKYRAAATHEQAPGAGSGHLADLLSMPYEDRLAYQMDPRSSWVDGKGRDRLYAAAGLITEPSQRMVGAYTPAGGTLEINPGEVARPLVMTADGAVTARDRQLMDIVESSRAFVDAQNAGAWHKPIPQSQTGAGARSSLSIPLEANPSPKSMSALSALANKYGMFAVDTGNGVNLINDPWSDIGASRTGTTLGKELKGDMGKELQAQLGGVQPERYKIDTGYQNYQDVLSQPGTGRATQRFLDKLDENQALMSNIEPELRSKAYANMLRDEQMAKDKGMSVRADIQLARKILAAEGVKGLRDALKAGVILPAAAVAILLPVLNQSQESQQLELVPGS